MQTLVLKVVEGPDLGLQTFIRSGQKLRVGRSSWAEMSCSGDEELQEIHFQILSTSSGWSLNSARPEYTVFCNGQPIRQTLLKHGDLIVAGNSHFQVRDAAQQIPQKKTVEAIQEESSEPEQVEAETPALAILLADLQISTSLDVNNPELEASEVIAELKQEEFWGDTVRLIAALIGAQKSVAWEMEAYQTYGQSLPELNPEVQSVAEAWQNEPTEENRREAEKLVDVAGLETPAGWIAQTIFWSAGSLSAPDLPEAPAPPTLFTKAVHSTLLFIAITVDPAELPNRWIELIALGESRL
ncbi:MAG TPA: hypothetical protein DD473_06245 [Planctomycetaceae bacterium]|nr:hypothetical protein [Planctomycetaceae bacterium]